MLPMDPAVVGPPMALALGLFFGMGPCLLACLPYLGPVFVNADGGVRQSWRVMLPLTLGRLTAYGALGLLAGLAGQTAVAKAGDGVIRVVVGSAAVLVGLALLLRRRAAGAACAGDPALAAQPAPLRRMVRTPGRALMPGGLYLMGIGMALNACAPLALILTAAAISGDGLQGMTVALCFGLGASVAPSLAYGVGAAYFGSRLRHQLGAWRPALERLSAGLLIVVGLSNLLK